MNKQPLIFILTIFLISLLAPEAQATNHLPPTTLVFPMQQQDEEPDERPAQLGENRGEIPEGDSEIWTYQGQAGDILTIKAEADKPANEAEDRTGLLDMLLIVYAPDGTIIAKADDIQPSTVTDAVIEGLQLPTHGTYKIEVLGLEKQGSGAYTLTLQAANATPADPTPTINPDWPTLTIENQLEETICYVYIWPTSADELGDEWLGTKEVILPNDEYQWYVAPDEYGIAVSDCYGNTLDVRLQFDVTQPSTLTISPSALDGPSAQCAEGAQLARDGKPREALPQLEVAFANREATTFTDPDILAYCAAVLGQLRYGFGNLSGALEAYQVALNNFQASGSRELEGITLNNIGTVYENQGKYEKALEEYEQALFIRREVGDRAGEGTTLNNIGTAYHDQGKYEQALEQYQQALFITREVGDRAGEGATLNNIGEVYRAQGKYKQALEQYKQALFIRREVGDRAGEGITLNNIGLAYHNQGKYEQALEQYEQELEIIREVGDQASEGATLNNIGEVYRAQGKYEQALEQYQQALFITREVGNRAGEGVTLNNIGLVYDNQGKYEQALEQYEQGLEIIREVGDQASEGSSLNNIGLAYEQQGQTEEALLYYEQAMNVFEAVRATAGDDQERASFITQHANLYQRAIGLYHQQGQEEDAFLTSERGRARSFLDSLATGDVQLSDDDLQALIDQERKAYDKRFAIRDELARMQAQNPPDAELIADLEARLEAAEEAYSKALADIEARGDELAALVPGRSGVSTLTEVQALLDEQTTLLSYWVLGEEEGTLAFVITADESRVVELPDATPDKLTEALSSLYDWLEKDDPDELKELYSWLVAPLAEHLKTPKVGIIGHQELHEVPFAALTDGERYFGEQYTLFRVPSASALSHIQKNAANLAPATQPALVFGNPTTGEELFGPLVHAGKEAASVAELLEGAVYVETEANEARLWSEAVGAPVVHLAAHGSYNSANALYSAIHLAPQGDHNGRLETHEVYGLDLSAAEMVVLSACQTNVGDVSRSDEIVGLTRAFFFAGTPTLVSSLWNVDDAATEKLMSAFYRNWQSGMGKAEALQAAQAELRKTHPGPFYWAAFVLNGDPGEISFDRLRNRQTPKEAPAPTQTASSEAPTPAATETPSPEVPTPAATEIPSPEPPNSAQQRPVSWLIAAIIGVLAAGGLVLVYLRQVT
ncbi:MAG: tetratricopeptide repeat protein [Ardenticatenaceae bacterium]